MLPNYLSVSLLYRSFNKKTYLGNTKVIKFSYNHKCTVSILGQTRCEARTESCRSLFGDGWVAIK